MNNEIKNQNHLDILFEGRNKSYGAYELRSNYNKRARNAMLTMICFCILITVSAELLADKKPNHSGVWTTTVVNMQPDIKNPPKKVDEPKKPITKKDQPKSAQPRARTPKLNQPKVAPRVVVDDTPIKVDTTTFDPVKPVSYNPTGTDTSGAIALGPTTPTTTGEGAGGTTTPGSGTEVTKTGTEIKNQGELDELPEYPGGIDVFRSLLGSELVYPEEAVERSIEGKVEIEFVMDENGSISNVKLKEKIGYGCDQEAMRVFKKLSKVNWKPAKIAGQPVKTYYQVPINFTLND